MKKYTFMIKPVYLGLSILEISKIDMCESLYDMLNHNMDKKQKAL